MKRLKEKLPELAIILVCMIILGVGVSQKEGFHMDELISFEFANGEYNPWIVPTQPQGRLAKFIDNEIDGATIGETFDNLKDTVADVLAHRGSSKLLSYKADVYEEPVWITSEQFHEYITVDETDDFNYLSVYFNVKDDNHPPLHFMLLHTMCSFFQGRAEAWMGCAINMICAAVCMLLLMQLGRLLAPVFGMEERGRFLGLLMALLYGLSTGCMATTLLIRMYGLMSCFCVALLYIHVKKWLAEGFDKKNKGLIAVTVLGFWSQYFFLFYCILLAAVTVVLLWCTKRRKELWRYVRAMITAAVIGVGVFPFAISDVFSSGRGVEALGNLASGLAGYGTRLISFGSILIDRTFGGLLWVILVLLSLILLSLILLARKNEKGRTEADSQDKADSPDQTKHRKGMLAMLVIPVLGYFLLVARMAPYLVDRYIMPVFPFVILLGALLLVGIAGRLERENPGKQVCYILCGAVVAIQLWGLLCYDGTYWYQDYDEQLAVAKQYAGTPCICVYDGVGYYENLQEFTHYGQTLLVKAEELAGRKDVESVAKLEKLVLLTKSTVDWESVSRVLEEKYGLVCEQMLYENDETGDRVHLFVKAQN